MKKLSYLILIAAIAISGFFIYDTYKKVTGDNSSDNNKAEDASKSNISVKYNEYNLNTKYQYSLTQTLSGKTVIYFYNSSAKCTDTDIFKSTNSNLGLVLTVDTDKTTGAELNKIATSSLFVPQSGGKNLEITGLPGVKNSIQVTKDLVNSKLTGNIDLQWDNRTVSGSFTSTICGAI